MAAGKAHGCYDCSILKESDCDGHFDAHVTNLGYCAEGSEPKVAACYRGPACTAAGASHGCYDCSVTKASECASSFNDALSINSCLEGTAPTKPAAAGEEYAHPADGSCVDVGDGTSYRFYCGEYADIFIRNTRIPPPDTDPAAIEAAIADTAGDDLCDLTRDFFEGGFELACADWLGAGHTCGSTWPEVCGGDHPFGALFNVFPLGFSCPQCSDYCPITKERCEIIEDLGGDLGGYPAANCNCGDCGFPACGDCDCDHYGEHCCTGNDH